MTRSFARRLNRRTDGSAGYGVVPFRWIFSVRFRKEKFVNLTVFFSKFFDPKMDILQFREHLGTNLPDRLKSGLKSRLKGTLVKNCTFGIVSMSQRTWTSAKIKSQKSRKTNFYFTIQGHLVPQTLILKVFDCSKLNREWPTESDLHLKKKTRMKALRQRNDWGTSDQIYFSSNSIIKFMYCLIFVNN